MDTEIMGSYITFHNYVVELITDMTIVLYIS